MMTNVVCTAAKLAMDSLFVAIGALNWGQQVSRRKVHLFHAKQETLSLVSFLADPSSLASTARPKAVGSMRRDICHKTFFSSSVLSQVAAVAVQWYGGRFILLGPHHFSTLDVFVFFGARISV